MAMPRVGVTLLALVSISSLFQKVTGTSPPGVNWLKATSLGIFVSALATVVAHCWILTCIRNQEQQEKKASGSGTPVRDPQVVARMARYGGIINLALITSIIPCFVCGVVQNTLFLLGADVLAYLIQFGMIAWLSRPCLQSEAPTSSSALNDIDIHTTQTTAEAGVVTRNSQTGPPTQAQEISVMGGDTVDAELELGFWGCSRSNQGPVMRK